MALPETQISHLSMNSERFLSERATASQNEEIREVLSSSFLFSLIPPKMNNENLAQHPEYLFISVLGKVNLRGRKMASEGTV